MPWQAGYVWYRLRPRRADLAALARNAVPASCLDEPGRRALTAEVDALPTG